MAKQFEISKDILKIQYENTIDFDDAFKEWRKNKKYLGNGYFEYKCRHFSITKSKFCNNKIVSNGYCRFHLKELRF